jgi:hypothetical protein
MPVFHAWVKASDAVMPLTHPINTDLQKYAEDQISGAFHLGFGYRKPLLMHEFFARYPEFVGRSLFYDLDSLAVFLKELPQTLRTQQPEYNDAKWTFEGQAKNYIRFLQS